MNRSPLGSAVLLVVFTVGAIVVAVLDSMSVDWIGGCGGRYGFYEQTTHKLAGYGHRFFDAAGW